jgi:hypothetical protein
MFLRDLSIETPKRSKIAFDLSEIVPGITQLYLSCLGKRFDSGQFFKVIVEVGGSGDLSIEKIADVVLINERFDFVKYGVQDIPGKRKMVIDVLQSGLLAISNAEGWESSRLIDAYGCCLSRNLEYRFIWKDKYWRSPNKEIYAAVYCCYEVEQFEAYVIFFDSKKNEISRRKLMESPPWSVEPFDRAIWSEDSSQFFVYPKYTNTHWVASLNN